MFQIDLKNRKPIYEQIVENYKRLIISGELSENSKVPSIREMAKTLGVNPNTVQKAYRELESSSYFYTVLGQGNFIAAPPDTKEEIEALLKILEEQIHELIFRGETIENIKTFMNNILEKYKEDNHGKNK